MFDDEEKHLLLHFKQGMRQFFPDASIIFRNDTSDTYLYFKNTCCVFSYWSSHGSHGCFI